MGYKRLVDVNTGIKLGMVIAVVDNVNDLGAYEYTTGELYDVERYKNGAIRKLSISDPIIQVLDIGGNILYDNRTSESAQILLTHQPFIMVFEVTSE